MDINYQNGKIKLLTKSTQNNYNEKINSKQTLKNWSKEVNQETEERIKKLEDQI